MAAIQVAQTVAGTVLLLVLIDVFIHEINKKSLPLCMTWPIISKHKNRLGSWLFNVCNWKDKR